MYLVTGATGHVGSTAAGHLLDGGKAVRLMVRDPGRVAALAARGAEVVAGDLGDAEAVARAAAGVEGAFVLLPPDTSAPDPRAAQRRVAEAIAAGLARARAPHVVLLSSLGADLDRGTGPVLGLHVLEELLAKTGLRVTALRPGFFAENVAPMIPVARAQGIYPSMMPPDVPIPMIATRDIGAEAARALLDPPAASRVIDLAGPAVTSAEVAAVLARVLGRPVALVTVPPEGQLGALTAAGVPPAFAELYVELNTAAREGRLRPVGDRLVHGPTTLEEVVRGLVAG